MGTPYGRDDAAKDTGTDPKSVDKAWHQAREDCQTSDHPVDKSLSGGWDRKTDAEEDKK